MDIQEAVIERINKEIMRKGITVNEAAVRSGIPPSTLKNILYGKSKNVGIVTIKTLCDGLEISIQDFFEDTIFSDLEQELK
ncbi:MAG TPA: helix-turn-helix transcriptional regulator [Firmicutes bacterium]|nr:helix-turn-helix transcriptional regulator [Bacillota bacterium]